MRQRRIKTFVFTHAPIQVFNRSSYTGGGGSTVVSTAASQMMSGRSGFDSTLAWTSLSLCGFPPTVQLGLG